MRIPVYNQIYQNRVPSAPNPYPDNIKVATPLSALSEGVNKLIPVVMNARDVLHKSNSAAYYNENVVKLLEANEKSKNDLLANINEENAMELTSLYQEEVKKNYDNFQSSPAYNSAYSEANEQLYEFSMQSVIHNVPDFVKKGATYVEQSIIGKTDTAASNLGTAALTNKQNYTFILEGVANLYKNIENQKGVAPATAFTHASKSMSTQAKRYFDENILKADTYTSQKNFSAAASALNKAEDLLLNEKHLVVPQEDGTVKFFSFKNKSQEFVQKAADEINVDAPADRQAYVINTKYMLGEQFDTIYEDIQKSRMKLYRAMREKSDSSGSGSITGGPMKADGIPTFSFPFSNTPQQTASKEKTASAKMINNGRQITIQQRTVPTKAAPTTAAPTTAAPAIKRVSHSDLIGD